jgi:hypothetical protein
MTDPRQQGNGRASATHGAIASAGNGAMEDSALGPRRVGYGLPCAKCKTYYAADLAVCPVCQTKERVSPASQVLPVSVAPSEELPDPELLEEERERFLQEFKSQGYATGLESTAAPAHDCRLREHHSGGPEAATVCESCYERLQERVDHMEASLHIDLQEASQIVYDAVWANPSDPSKTYQHAAQALLLELRKRAGVKLVLGPLQRLPH